MILAQQLSFWNISYWYSSLLNRSQTLKWACFCYHTFLSPSTKTFNMLVYTYEQPSSFPVTLCLSEESVTVSIRDTLNLFKWTEIADLHVAPCLKCVYIFWVKHQLVTEISQVAGEMVICLDAPVCLQSQPAPPSLLVGDDVYKHMLNPPLRYSARLKLIWVC